MYIYSWVTSYSGVSLQLQLQKILECSDHYLLITVLKAKDQVDPLNHYLLLLLLLLLLCPCPPVCVVDGSILQERGKDEDKAHDQVNVYRLHI